MSELAIHAAGPSYQLVFRARNGRICKTSLGKTGQNCQLTDFRFSTMAIKVTSCHFEIAKIGGLGRSSKRLPTQAKFARPEWQERCCKERLVRLRRRAWTSAQARQRGVRPSRLCHRISPQSAGRRADARATAEGFWRLLVEREFDHRSRLRGFRGLTWLAPASCTTVVHDRPAIRRALRCCSSGCGRQTAAWPGPAQSSRPLGPRAFARGAGRPRAGTASI